MSFEKLEDVLGSSLVSIRTASFFSKNKQSVRDTFTLNIVELLKLIGKLQEGKGSEEQHRDLHDLARGTLKMAELEITVPSDENPDRRNEWFTLRGCCLELLSSFN